MEDRATKLIEMPFDASGEARFWRGFTHRVQEVIRAIEGHVTQAQLSKLREWMSSDVQPWGLESEFVEPPPAPDLGE
jgi:hypothetical protein